MIKMNKKNIDKNNKIRMLEIKIEEYKKYIEISKKLEKGLTKKINDLQAIIKEVKEYIESYMPNYDFDKTNLIKLLEILQGVDKEWIELNI